MSAETTPSSQYADWELPISEAERAMWKMRAPTAEDLIDDIGPVSPLTGRDSTLGKTFEPLHTIDINGHPVAWMKVGNIRNHKLTVNNGFDPLPLGTGLHCPCDMDYRVIDGGSQGKEVMRVQKPGCDAKKKAIVAFHIVESLARGYDAKKQFKPKFSLESAHKPQEIKDTILSLVEEGVHRRLWVGNTAAGLVFPHTIQSILGMPRGDSGDKDTASQRRAARWSYFHELVAEGRLEHDGNWALRLPNRNVKH